MARHPKKHPPVLKSNILYSKLLLCAKVLRKDISYDIFNRGDYLTTNVFDSQFLRYRMIKMATKNSFCYLYYLPCAIRLPSQQRVHRLHSCMQGTHCDSKAPLRRSRYNGYTIYLDLNRASRLDLLLCLKDDKKCLH